MGAEEAEPHFFETTAFGALERDFQEALSELVGDKSLEKFREEYQKVSNTLKQSHERESRLVRRCKDLSAELQANNSKVQLALKLCSDDQEIIASLKREIENSWKLVNNSHDKEMHARDTIHQLKDEIANLNKLVEYGAGLALGQEFSMKDLLLIKDELTKEREKLTTKNKSQATQIESLNAKIESLEKEQAVQQAEKQLLKDFLATKKAETEREQVRKERLERELKETKLAAEAQETLLRVQVMSIADQQAQLEQMQLLLHEQKSITTKITREKDHVSHQAEKQLVEVSELLHVKNQLADELAHKTLEVMHKDDETRKLETTEQQMGKAREALLSKIKMLECKFKEQDDQKADLRKQIALLEREIENFKRLSDIDKKAIEELQRERDVMTKKVIKWQQNTARTQNSVKMAEKQKHVLDQEIQAFKNDAHKQRKSIYSLEKEREQHMQESSDSASKWQAALKEIKLRDMTLAELLKKIADDDAKLKQQQNLYEQVRSERNNYSKSLIEHQNEIGEMRRKFKILNQQIDQLKDENKSKDKALNKEQFERAKVEKLKDMYKDELDKIKNLVESTEQTIDGQHAEIQKQRAVIKEKDAAFLQKGKEMDSVVHDRDMLGAQLIRRNKEVALLYEKIKIHLGSIGRGEAQFRERGEHIRLLKLKLKDLKREVAIDKTHLGSVEEQRSEIYRLQRELLSEQSKVKALSEELQSPLNIHRWRKLEATDPTSYELLLRIAVLQRRLISKTEECADSTEMASRKQQQLDDMQSKLDVQAASGELLNRLKNTQHDLLQKTRLANSLEAELQSRAAQHQELSKQLQQQGKLLNDYKTRFLDLKMASQRRSREAFDNNDASMAEDFGR